MPEPNLQTRLNRLNDELEAIQDIAHCMDHHMADQPETSWDALTSAGKERAYTKFQDSLATTYTYRGVYEANEPISPMAALQKEMDFAIARN